MAKKKVAAVVKIQISAGAATAAPPVGTALGPHGINIMEFVKQYNAATEAQRGMVIPAEITIRGLGILPPLTDSGFDQNYRRECVSATL